MSIPLTHDLLPGTRGRADRAALELVRIVMADDWAPEAAAQQLSAHVDHDPAVLRLLRACVAKVNLQRSTPVSLRASLTLDLADPSGDRAVRRETERSVSRRTSVE